MSNSRHPLQGCLACAVDGLALSSRYNRSTVFLDNLLLIIYFIVSPNSELFNVLCCFLIIVVWRDFLFFLQIYHFTAVTFFCCHKL